MEIPIKLINVSLTLKNYNENKFDQLRIITKESSDLKIEYNIISYCWDSRKIDAFNVYDGIDKIKIESCKKDAFILMLEICQTLSFKFIWIDVVCVSNVPEVCKMQLAEMGMYYKRAQKCLVFPDGLNNYNHPIHNTGNIGKWYDRSWTVQESYYTRDNKIFVYIISHDLLKFMCKYNNNVKYKIIRNLSDELKKTDLYRGNPQDLCIVSIDENDHAHFCNIFINVINNFYQVFNNYDIESDNDKEYLFDGIKEKNFVKYYANTQLKECEVKFTELLKPMNIVTVIRESLYRDCKKIQDKIYGIMTILNISLNIDYDIEMNDLIHQTISHLDNYHLICFILANLFDESLLNCNLQNFHVKNSFIPYFTNTNSKKRIKKYFYDIEVTQPVQDIKYTDSELSIKTLSANVIIKFLKPTHIVLKNGNNTHIYKYYIEFLADSSIKVSAEGYTYTDNTTILKLLYICNSFDDNTNNIIEHKNFHHIFLVIHKDINKNKWYKIGTLQIHYSHLYSKKKKKNFPELDDNFIWQNEHILIV